MGSSLPDLLHRRSLGSLRPWSFLQAVAEGHVRRLRLSPLRDVDADQHSAAITDLSLDPAEGRYLLAGAYDGTLYIHDLAGSGAGPRFTARLVSHVGRSHPRAHRSSVECVQWYPADSGIFVTSGTDGEVKIWDANRLVPADSYHFEGKVHCHHLSSHQLIAVATSVNHVHLVDLRSGANTHELRGHAKAVIACRWSNRDDNLLATGGAEGKVMLWDVRQGKSCLRSLDYRDLLSGSSSTRSKKTEAGGVSHDGRVVGLRFTGDGLCLLSLGSDKKLRKWCMETGCNMKARFPPLTTKRKLSSAFAVGCGFAFVPSDSSVVVLGVDDYSESGSLEGHYCGVNCCEFNELTQELYSGGMDRNILIWEANVSQAKEFEEEETTRAGRSLAGVTTLDAWSSSDGED